MSEKFLSLQEMDKLQKCMGMTTSVHDGEALAAIRAANALLGKYSISWADVFNRVVQVKVVEAAPAASAGSSNGSRRPDASRDGPAAINEAFEEILARQLSERSRAFIESLQQQWVDKGFLTEKQRAALFRNLDGGKW